MDLTIIGKLSRTIMSKNNKGDYPFVLEVLFWSVISTLILASDVSSTPTPEWEIVSYPIKISYLIKVSSLASLVALFPLLFLLIFGELPIERIHLSVKKWKIERSPLEQAKERARASQRERELEQHEGLQEQDQKRKSSVGHKAEETSKTLHPGEDLYLSYTKSSRQLANKIYTRAGVYLLVGVLIAIGGLVFFYSTHNPSVSTNEFISKDEIPSPSNSQDNKTVEKTTGIPQEKYLYALIPNIGVLLFIEFIAMFFLRQYRSAMDEFRHYDAIARSREEIAAFIAHSKNSEEPVDLMQLIRAGVYFSKGSTLQKDQSTEIIETRKLERNEIDLLGKVVETLAKR